MNSKKFYWVSGLPRSGSTLLCNILAQNPRFHTTSTSGVMDLIFTMRNQWDNQIEFKATPNPEAKKRVMRGILDNFYSNIEKPIIFDKCRGWTSLLEMSEFILEGKSKILVPVRDISDVLASFEKLWRKQSASRQVSTEQQYYFDFQTTQGRCATWMRGDQPIGLAYNRIKDALQRGYADRLHFVEYNKLTTNPKKTMTAVYEFLEEPLFEHNFENVEQITKEDDSVFGFGDLHSIRTKVEPNPSNAMLILGETAKKYQNAEFWRKNNS